MSLKLALITLALAAALPNDPRTIVPEDMKLAHTLTPEGATESYAAPESQVDELLAHRATHSKMADGETNDVLAQKLVGKTTDAPTPAPTCAAADGFDCDDDVINVANIF